MLTGCGTAVIFTKDGSHDLTLSIINKQSMYGLHNPLDSNCLSRPLHDVCREYLETAINVCSSANETNNNNIEVIYDDNVSILYQLYRSYNIAFYSGSDFSKIDIYS